MRGALLVMIAMIGFAAPASAAKRTATATNGVQVVIDEGDGFSPGSGVMSPNHSSFEYAGTSYYYALMGGRDNATGAELLMISGALYYRGDWRFYERAYFKGGSPATFEITDRAVGAGSCRSGCSLHENFTIPLTSDQIAKFADAEGLSVKLVARRGEGFVITIPKAEIEAVREVIATLRR